MLQIHVPYNISTNTTEEYQVRLGSERYSNYSVQAAATPSGWAKPFVTCWQAHVTLWYV